MKWSRELSNSITTLTKLRSCIDLREEELRFPRLRKNKSEQIHPVRIPPVFAELLSRKGGAAREVIRRQFVPTEAEYTVLPGESLDPLCEVAYSPLSRLIHRYPDRVLLITTEQCAVYCRYCFRRRFTERAGAINSEEIKEASEYVTTRSEIREIIFSGGDPLMLDDGTIEGMLSEFSALRKTRAKPLSFRIATRIPTALPSRITGGLLRILQQYVPLWLVLHCNHTEELTPRGTEAISRIVDAGIPVVSQTVLLRGVNDRSETLAELFENLVSVRVKPYYLFQGDAASGTSHFRVSLPRAFEIIRDLRGRISGLAMPVFATDLPGGGGKKTLHEDMSVRRENGNFLFTGNDGRTYRYPDESNSDATYCHESRPLL